MSSEQKLEEATSKEEEHTERLGESCGGWESLAGVFFLGTTIYWARGLRGRVIGEESGGEKGVVPNTSFGELPSANISVAKVNFRTFLGLKFRMFFHPTHSIEIGLFFRFPMKMVVCHGREGHKTGRRKIDLLSQPEEKKY